MRDRRPALLCLGLAACSYDWAPGASAGDASSDANVDGGGPGDALSEGDTAAVDAPGVDGATDAVNEPPSCADLEAQVTQTFGVATACTPTAQPCMLTTGDACGCTVILGAPGQAATDYESAVSALVASSCPLGCSGSCGPAPQKGLCIVADASAPSYACQQ